MPTVDRYELPNTLLHRGWSIKYLIYEAETRSALTRAWVVFVHGTPWSSDVFRPLMGALRATGLYNIVLYDLPGYGQSQAFVAQDEFETDTSVKAQGESFAALLGHLNLDGKEPERVPHVVAHDIAGVITLRAHLLHACEYRSLCLLDTNCVLPWGDTLYNLVRSNPHVFEGLPPRVFKGFLKAVIESARVEGEGLGPEWLEVLMQPWLTHNTAPPSHQYSPQANFVRQIKQADDQHTADLLDANLYARVRCDVRILRGEKDAWIPLEKMQQLALMLGSRLKGFTKIPNASHLVMLDQPEMVAIEISRWLEHAR
ncbi:alpha/beta-hydrolase [Thozetella sp. PMI_491]|nr:alpha/beta-hydrolase [Thozetella sp. PMI_491]